MLMAKFSKNTLKKGVQKVINILHTHNVKLEDRAVQRGS